MWTYILLFKFINTIKSIIKNLSEETLALTIILILTLIIINLWIIQNKNSTLINSTLNNWPDDDNDDNLNKKKRILMEIKEKFYNRDGRILNYLRTNIGTARFLFQELNTASGYIRLRSENILNRFFYIINDWTEYDSTIIDDDTERSTKRVIPLIMSEINEIEDIIRNVIILIEETEEWLEILENSSHDNQWIVHIRREILEMRNIIKNINMNIIIILDTIRNMKITNDLNAQNMHVSNIIERSTNIENLAQSLLTIRYRERWPEIHTRWNEELISDQITREEILLSRGIFERWPFIITGIYSIFNIMNGEMEIKEDIEKLIDKTNEINIGMTELLLIILIMVFIYENDEIINEVIELWRDKK